MVSSNHFAPLSVTIFLSQFVFVRIPLDGFTEASTQDRILTQKELETFEIHPGDQLCCLGYPLSLESNAAGFPILRTGTIASYPILPVKDNATFLFAFEVFGGNSGGPVYFVAHGRTYGGTTHLDKTIHGIVGIVTSEITQNEYTETTREKRVSQTSLGICQVIQGEFIKELINSMPEK